MVIKSPIKVAGNGNILARQVNFGSYTVLAKERDEDVGIGASSSLVSSDGQHFIHWENSQFGCTFSAGAGGSRLSQMCQVS